MFFYGDDVNKWNAVDVLINGQLQHGHIINVAANRLLIDFGCPARRSQLVEYGKAKIFRYHYQYASTFVEVLLRGHPDGVWTWYTGDNVPVDGYSSADFEYVEVRRPYVTVRELVPRKQIRLPLECVVSEYLRVKEGDFLIRSFPLPLAYRSSSRDSQLLWQIFNGEMARRHNLLFTGVLGEEICYLQHRTGIPLTSLLVESMCRARAFHTPNDAGTMRIAYAGTSEPPEEVVKMRLPPELLVEIFQSLDSIGRIRCRRVSPLWNDILTTETHFPDVRVSGYCAEYGGADLPGDGMYWVAACLLKCVSTATKWVAVSKLHLYDNWLLPATIKHILAPARLPVLVFYDCDVGGKVSCIKDVTARTADFIVECSCDRIVWKKCRLEEESFGVLVTQESLSVQSHHQIEMQLWDVFERNVSGQLRDRQALQKWITEWFSIQTYVSSIYQELILKVLNEYQNADPRVSTHYRQREWTAANIADLDAGQLTALTVAVLSKYCT